MFSILKASYVHYLSNWTTINLHYREKNIRTSCLSLDKLNKKLKPRSIRQPLFLRSMRKMTLRSASKINDRPTDDGDGRIYKRHKRRKKEMNFSAGEATILSLTDVGQLFWKKKYAYQKEIILNHCFFFLLHVIKCVNTKQDIFTVKKMLAT